MYREEIKKISKKARLSEIYVVNKLLELGNKENKHIGLYLLSDEKEILQQVFVD